MRKGNGVHLALRQVVVQSGNRWICYVRFLSLRVVSRDLLYLIRKLAYLGSCTLNGGGDLHTVKYFPFPKRERLEEQHTKKEGWATSLQLKPESSQSHWVSPKYPKSSNMVVHSHLKAQSITEKQMPMTTTNDSGYNQDISMTSLHTCTHI